MSKHISRLIVVVFIAIGVLSHVFSNDNVNAIYWLFLALLLLKVIELDENSNSRIVHADKVEVNISARENELKAVKKKVIK